MTECQKFSSTRQKILFRSVERGELERNVVLNNGAYHSARRKEIGVKRNYLRWYSVRKGHLQSSFAELRYVNQHLNGEAGYWMYELAYHG